MYPAGQFAVWALKIQANAQYATGGHVLKNLSGRQHAAIPGLNIEPLELCKSHLFGCFIEITYAFFGGAARETLVRSIRSNQLSGTPNLEHATSVYSTHLPNETGAT